MDPFKGLVELLGVLKDRPEWLGIVILTIWVYFERADKNEVRRDFVSAQAEVVKALRRIRTTMRHYNNLLNVLTQRPTAVIPIVADEDEDEDAAEENGDSDGGGGSSDGGGKRG